MSDLAVISPFIAAILIAAAILVVDFALPGRRGPALAVAFVGLGLVGLLTALVGQDPLPKHAFDGAYVVDALTTFLDILFVTIVALTIAFAPDYLEERDLPVAEFAAVLIFAMSGAMLISGSADLLVMFLGPRADGAAGLRDGRLPQVRRLLDRGRDQVLPARLVLERHPAVRARVRVGPDRHDADRRACPTSSC